MKTPTQMKISSASSAGMTPSATLSATARATACWAGPNICTACLAPLMVTLLNITVGGLHIKFGATTARSAVKPSLLLVSALQKAASAALPRGPRIRSIWATSLPSPTRDSPTQTLVIFAKAISSFRVGHGKAQSCQAEAANSSNCLANKLATVRSALVPGLMPRDLSAASQARSSGKSTSGSAVFSKRASQVRPSRCTASAAAAPHLRAMAIGEGGEKREVNPHDRPGVGQGGGEGGKTEAENIREMVLPLPRDHIAPGRFRHGKLQRNLRRGVHVVARGAAEPGGGGKGDGAEDRLGIGEIGFLQHRAERRPQRRFRPLGRHGQRRAEQDDAEIGVLPDRCARGGDRLENARTERRTGAAKQRRRNRGALLEIGDFHAMPRGKAMHVAGLGRGQFVQAGGQKRRSDAPAAIGPMLRHRRAAASAAARRSAIETVLTDCRPRQPGMELTSRIQSRPCASAMISTPA